jgi:hypothetical protein
MTSKEQALELYGKFFNNAESRNKIGLYDEDLHKYNAKQCVLVAVDEIIEYLQHKWDTIGFAEYLIDMNKYIEVKQEIEKL